MKRYTVVLNEEQLTEARKMLLSANDQQQHAETLDCLYTVITLLDLLIGEDVQELPE